MRINGWLKAAVGIGTVLFIGHQIDWDKIEAKLRADVAAYPSVGDKVEVKHTAVGCLSKDSLEHFVRLVAANDREAGVELIRNETGCRFLEKGTELMVDERPRFIGNSFCVRPIGESQCLWTNEGWIIKNK